jgi:putative DNA methylase
MPVAGPSSTTAYLFTNECNTLSMPESIPWRHPMTDRPPTLIESWLPFETIGAESLRDASAMRKPPLNRLHVWWARRPLTVSRSAILASLLPQWSQDWPVALHKKFPTEEAYQAWFVRLLGILGDPVAGRKLIQWARQRGIDLKENPYGDAPRAFTVNPSQENLKTMLDLLEHTWGTRQITVMDPMAGGGSIPFEALRYGFTVLAGELNPVASLVLKATLDYPARFGLTLADKIQKWGNEANRIASASLSKFFPMQPGERVRRYLWARTVACPMTGKPVPLSPNWWLSKTSKNKADWVAVRLLCEPDWDTCRFEIARGDRIDFDPSEGTISRGVGRSPWTGEAIDGDYIKREAQAGRMGQMLYALSIQTGEGYDFRIPTYDDLAAIQLAEAALAENLPRWEAAGLVPSEPIPEGLKTAEPLRYGMFRWYDIFSPRQLLSLLTFLEALRDVDIAMQKEMDAEQTAAVETYLAFALNKCPNYSSRLSVWHPYRETMANTFNRHDFAFAWSHGEMTLPDDGFLWAIDQIVDAYQELAELVTPTQLPLWTVEGILPVERLQITQGSATDLSHISTGSVHHICIDPPYYDNVMYAELSDFFYVWLKRAVGHLYPDFFRDTLTNKDDEAVANPARFINLGRGGARPRQLAKRDYERKMAAAFREMARVLRDDGVLTVMFTHKQVEAWDTLATALIGAGFTIRASWPVHTESEHSLHQAKKNAAASTILLVCRKRDEGRRTNPQVPRMGEDERDSSSVIGHSSSGEGVWWDDIQGRVRRVAREKAAQFAEQGISGVDLYISTFGPVLSVISERWPVLTSQVDERTGQPRPLRPETALDLAREEVIALRKRGLLRGREIQFDPVTDWYLMAWDAFRAEQFPADEARKLAIALGLDIEEDLVRRKRVISKKGSFVVLQQPKGRRRRGLADPEAVVFDTLLDAAHAAMLLYQEDGAPACAAFLKRAGLLADSTFKACLQAMLNAIPRTQIKGKFVRPEAEVLERMRLAFFEDLTAPVEEESEVGPRQLEMFGGGEGVEGEEEKMEKDRV